MRTLRSVAMVASTLGLLAGSVVQVTAQGEETAPQPPVEFTGAWCVGPPVAPDRGGTTTTATVGDEGLLVTRFRGGAWRNAVSMSDPRLQGDAYQTYESDTYRAPGTTSGPGVTAATLTIVNEAGAWVTGGLTGDLADGRETDTVFVGQGAYEGLVAIMSEDGAEVPRPTEVPLGFGPCNEVQGVIFEGAPLPEPYGPE